MLIDMKALRIFVKNYKHNPPSKGSLGFASNGKILIYGDLGKETCTFQELAKAFKDVNPDTAKASEMEAVAKTLFPNAEFLNTYMVWDVQFNELITARSPKEAGQKYVDKHGMAINGLDLDIYLDDELVMDGHVKRWYFIPYPDASLDPEIEVIHV